MKSRRKRRWQRDPAPVVLLGLLLLTTASLLDSTAGRERQEPGSGLQAVHVRLNGRPLASGVRIRDRHGQQHVLVSIVDLRAAIDGATPKDQRRLRLNEGKLYAIATGSCGTCRVRIRRGVLISSDIRMLEDKPYIPLGDLVRGFEGRLNADAGAGVYDIYAGACTWCILAPS